MTHSAYGIRIHESRESRSTAVDAEGPTPLRHPLCSRAASTDERMPEQRSHDDWNPNERRDRPVCNRRKLLP